MDFGPGKLDNNILLDYGVIDAANAQVCAYNGLPACCCGAYHDATHVHILAYMCRGKLAGCLPAPTLLTVR